LDVSTVEPEVLAKWKYEWIHRETDRWMLRQTGRETGA
jgi:hypothetical protein